MTFYDHHHDEEDAGPGERKIFYSWPRPSTLEFERLYEELRRRHPQAANINIGLALLKARCQVGELENSQEVLDEAEVWLKPATPGCRC